MIQELFIYNPAYISFGVLSERLAAVNHKIMKLFRLLKNILLYVL